MEEDRDRARSISRANTVGEEVVVAVVEAEAEEGDHLASRGKMEHMLRYPLTMKRTRSTRGRTSTSSRFPPMKVKTRPRLPAREKEYRTSPSV